MFGSLSKLKFGSDAIQFWTFICRKFVCLFLITDSISPLMIFSNYHFSWLSLGRLYISRYLSISSRLSNLLVCNYLWYYLTFKKKSLWYLLFFPLSFLFIGSFAFYSWWLWLEVYQFCLSFLKPSYWLHWQFLLF